MQCRTCALDLQNALRVLYAAVGADPARPQAVSRQFKLNKNLTWKVAKVIQSVDPIEAVPLIPGSEGMEIFQVSAAGAHVDVLPKLPPYLEVEIDKLLGKPWDDELETFRHAGEGAPVRWLHQVV